MPLYPPPNFVIGFSQNVTPPSISATADTSILPSFIGQKMIPAGWFTLGRAARLVVAGTLDSATLLPTATLKLKIGGQTITANATGLLASANGGNFELIARIQCIAEGVAGQVNVAGRANLVTALNGTVGATPLNAAGLALDTTVANAIDVTIAFGQSGNTLKPYVAFLELPTG